MQEKNLMPPPSTPPGMEIRLYRPRDYAAMSSLFTEVFKEPMSATFHAWKYRPGKSGAVVVLRDGELVAHYGGVGSAVLLRGEESSAMQIVDVMVKATARQGVRGSSPFFLAGSRFLEQFIGNEQPWRLGYGFPSDRHMRLAAHLGLYAPVGRMLELSWPSATVARALPWYWRVDTLSLDNVAHHGKALDTLWNAMRQDLTQACAVIKDYAWLRWRYLEHPERQYDLRLLRRRLDGRPLGLAVFKREASRWLLLDVIAPKRHIAALVGLVAAEANAVGVATVATWCSRAFVSWFPHEQAAVSELPIVTPANIWTPGPAPQTLEELWWLLPGDTDFL